MSKQITPCRKVFAAAVFAIVLPSVIGLGFTADHVNSTANVSASEGGANDGIQGWD